MKSYLEEKVAAPVYKTKNTVVGIRCTDHAKPSIRKKLALTSQQASLILYGRLLSNAVVALPSSSMFHIQQMVCCENEVLSEKQQMLNSFDFQ
jgi:hypothetical protein